MNPNIYRGPLICSSIFNVYLTDRNAKILDIGAGTGFVAEYLTKFGYTNIDALEPSEGMVAIAKAKNLYNNFVVEPIYADKTTSIPDGIDNY